MFFTSPSSVAVELDRIRSFFLVLRVLEGMHVIIDDVILHAGVGNAQPRLPVVRVRPKQLVLRRIVVVLPRHRKIVVRNPVFSRWVGKNIFINLFKMKE